MSTTQELRRRFRSCPIQPLHDCAGVSLTERHTDEDVRAEHLLEALSNPHR